MRKAAIAILLVAFLAGCGGSSKPSGGTTTNGGGKRTPTLTRTQFVSAMNKICSSANSSVAALQLTTSMKTWKRNGSAATTIAQLTLKGFRFLTPPTELKAAAADYVAAATRIVNAVRDATDAAKEGNVQKFDQAITEQQNAGTKARVAARKIGAHSCV
jgi:hypothetical protein